MLIPGKLVAAFGTGNAEVLPAVSVTLLGAIPGVIVVQPKAEAEPPDNNKFIAF